MTNQQKDRHREQMAEIRDKLLAWHRLHENLCREDPCYAKAASLAFLAHSIGMPLTDLPQFILHLDDYKRCVQNRGQCETHGDPGYSDN